MKEGYKGINSAPTMNSSRKNFLGVEECKAAREKAIWMKYDCYLRQADGLEKGSDRPGKGKSAKK